MIDKAYIDRMLSTLPDLEAAMSSPGVSADRKAMRELVRKHAALKHTEAVSAKYFRLLKEVEEHGEMIADPEADSELRELAQGELAALEEALPAAEREMMAALLPPDASEARNAILEIRAGTGGDEAALFAGDLFRMYNRFAESHNLKIGLIDASPSSIGGYKEIVFSVEGNGAYGLLRYEGGGHRVQRVPVTEASGRIHTSAATVAVFPEAEPEDDIQISPDEIRIDLFCASGPGGQGVNTTYSAVRITHLPTGAVAQSQDERSQHRNKEKAMTVLKSRILDAREREEQEKMGNTRRSMIGSGDRSERIRTYNFPQNRLTDHRINLTLYSLDRIVEGELQPVIDALRAHDVQVRLAGELGAGQDE